MPKYDDLNTRMIGLVGLVAVLLTCISIGGAQLMVQTAQNVEFRRKIEAATNDDNDKTLALQAAKLQIYGWADKDKQIVTIPIDRAMEFVVAEQAAKSKDGGLKGGEAKN